ncbi:MAG: GGDEF domain-containing protein [Eubacteriaceae bacterium]|uniref:GGDEF domain-containing protein n=1 Tax=Candidatus Pseudoramibacter fermentans TaxID=2594427 RepID=A0A6L5GPA9_9FIRM|nr:GGDEF domain-containing protein [Candidatus Pseudoramibacter fermentans]RRF92460.1 MAG: GGDEF domain-containing protein [Eubacteriaceae bacterium]
MFIKTRQKRIFIAAFAVVVVLLLLIESMIQIRSNRLQSKEAADLLIDQAGKIIANNKKEEKALTETLKETYITRAESVAYILDHRNGAATLADLKEIASLQKVDEIHIFDVSGTIVAGTEPKYYGLNFDSGEQMRYFKKMLTDKSLKMCQDVTPNTAEGKPMMYAICWNDTGTNMIQVGIEPVRLLNELRANEISEVVANMTSYEGTMMIVTTKKGKILGATDSALKGKTISAVGIDAAKAKVMGGSYVTKVNGTLAYCTMKTKSGYRIVVAQDWSNANKDVPQTLLIIASYLAFAGICMLLLLRRMAQRVAEEHREATTDAMTGFLNRRAYAEVEAAQTEDADPNLMYVYADINGLKATNDTLGHNAGDELITAAARCMAASFGDFGRLYRVGGDEFIAVIAVPTEQRGTVMADFAARVGAWRGSLVPSLSVSYGSASRHEFPDAAIGELQHIAETRMYQMKRQYYEESGEDRRKN